MTAQIKEKLFIDGKEYGIATEPLEPYIQQMKPRPKFQSYMTGCWRGYFGSWELQDNKLYLIDFSSTLELDNKIVKIGLDYLFPSENSVFASWFNGAIRVPHGMVTKNIHAGYFTEFEKEFNLEFKAGILINYTTKRF